MDDPFESRLRSMMQASDDRLDSDNADDERLDRVLHKAHVRSGIFDILTLFAHWGWVIAQAGGRSSQRRTPRSRSSTSHNNAGE
jgi:hypothetical protein